MLLAGLSSLAGAGSGMAQKAEITVGTALSLTGRFSADANDHLKAYQLFIEEVNGKGGVMVKGLGKRLPLKLVSYDDQSDASTSAKLYERLITGERVDLLWSSWGSGNNFAVTAVTEKHRFPMVLASAASDSIYNRGFRHIFNTTDLASVLPRAVATYLRSRPREIRSVAILYENFLFTASLNDALLKDLAGSGVNIVLNEKYPIAGKDFTGLLTKVKSLAPDALVLLNIMPASIYATRQMREIGLAPRFYAVGVGPMFTKEFTEGLGPLAEGVVEMGFWHPDLPYPGARSFDDRFSARYGKPPSTDAAYAYMAAQILAEAVERAGRLDREKIAEVLRRDEFVTIGGKYRYDERGVNVHQNPFLVQVQNGRRVVVWPQELTRNQLRFPVFAR